jgi:hypothetical protein
MMESACQMTDGITVGIGTMDVATGLMPPLQASLGTIYRSDMTDGIAMIQGQGWGHAVGHQDRFMDGITVTAMMKQEIQDPDVVRACSRMTDAQTPMAGMMMAFGLDPWVGYPRRKTSMFSGRRAVMTNGNGGAIDDGDMITAVHPPAEGVHGIMMDGRQGDMLAWTMYMGIMLIRGTSQVHPGIQHPGTIGGGQRQRQGKYLLTKLDIRIQSHLTRTPRGIMGHHKRAYDLGIILIQVHGGRRTRDDRGAHGRTMRIRIPSSCPVLDMMHA